MPARLTEIRPGLLALAVVAFAVALRVPLLSGGQMDYDEGVYWQSLRNMAAGHPLFSAVYSSQPPAFLELLLPSHVLLGGSIEADRTGVLVLTLTGLVAVYRIGSTLATAWTGLLAVTLLAADPLFFRQSVTLQADGPAVSLGLASLAIALEARRRPGRGGWLLAAVTGAVLAVAVLTKILVVAAAPAVAVALAGQPQDAAWRRALVGLAMAALGGVVATLLLLLPFIGSLGLVWQQAVGFHLQARALEVGGLDPETLLHELPLAVVGLAGLAIAIRRAPLLAATAGAWMVIAAIFVAVQRPLWPHHLLILVPPLALWAGALALLPTPRPALVVGTLAIAGCLVAATYTRSLQSPTPEAAVAALRTSTAPGDLVVTDDPFAAALADRSTPPELVDTTRVRMNSGELTPAQAEEVTSRPRVRAVLLATDRLANLPGFQVWVTQHFPTARDLGEGQLLYLRLSGPG
ncbi:MAG TPA: glycosyltransferase family 39 protein [Candidatus Dormibacteraeota bacterium]